MSSLSGTEICQLVVLAGTSVREGFVEALDLFAVRLNFVPPERQTALLAIEAGRPEVLSYLRERRGLLRCPSLLVDCLKSAIEHGEVTIVRQLIEWGADLNARQLLPVQMVHRGRKIRRMEEREARKSAQELQDDKERDEEDILAALLEKQGVGRLDLRAHSDQGAVYIRHLLDQRVVARLLSNGACRKLLWRLLRHGGLNPNPDPSLSLSRPRSLLGEIVRAEVGQKFEDTHLLLTHCLEVGMLPSEGDNFSGILREAVKNSNSALLSLLRHHPRSRDWMTHILHTLPTLPTPIYGTAVRRPLIVDLLQLALAEGASHSTVGTLLEWVTPEEASSVVEVFHGLTRFIRLSKGHHPVDQLALFHSVLLFAVDHSVFPSLLPFLRTHWPRPPTGYETEIWVPTLSALPLPPAAAGHSGELQAVHRHLLDWRRRFPGDIPSTVRAWLGQAGVDVSTMEAWLRDFSSRLRQVLDPTMTSPFSDPVVARIIQYI